MIRKKLCSLATSTSRLTSMGPKGTKAQCHYFSYGSQRPSIFKEIQEKLNCYENFEFDAGIPRWHQAKDLQKAFWRAKDETGWDDRGLERRIENMVMYEVSWGMLRLTGDVSFLVEADLWRTATPKGANQVKSVHGLALKFGLLESEWGAARMIRMYGDWFGISTTAAEHIFKECRERGEVLYNSLLYVYAKDEPEKAEPLFKQMVTNGIAPSGETFRALLAALSLEHVKNAEAARDYLIDMEEKYGVRPERIHYGAVVDAYARGRAPEHILQAIEIVKRYPLAAHEVSFNAILSRCVPPQFPSEEELERIEVLIPILREFVGFIHGKGYKYSVLKTTFERLENRGLKWPKTVGKKE